MHDSFANSTGRPGSRVRRTLIAVLLVGSVLVWGTLLVRLWQLDARFTARALVLVAMSILMAVVAMRVWKRRQASLWTWVVVLPLVIAIVSWPLRTIVTHLKLNRELLAIGVSDFTLAAERPSDAGLAHAASILGGPQFESMFQADLTQLDVDLRRSDTARVTRLPTSRLQSVVVTRHAPEAADGASESTTARLDDRLIAWINTGKRLNVVRISLAQPDQQELNVLSRLTRKTSLTVQGLLSGSRQWRLPAVYELTLDQTDLTGESSQPQEFDLPQLQRLFLQQVSLDDSAALMNRLDGLHILGIYQSRLTPAAWQSVLNARIRHLRIYDSAVDLPARYVPPSTSQPLGTSLEVSGAGADNGTIIDWIAARQVRHVRWFIADPLTPQEFSRLLLLPRVEFVFLLGGQYTRQHLSVLKSVRKPLHLSLRDVQVAPEDEAWLRPQLPYGMNLVIQRQPGTEATSATEGSRTGD
ncbi:MAG: hypothetical protein D6753_18495 [Planctomycetota bacterium]|nr:MAG: hypothetical protein D6753_18495 [Planctomycetota bacterium]